MWGDAYMDVVVKTVLGSHLWLGECTAHFRIYFGGDGIGCSLGVWDFDPWPHVP